MVALVVPTGRDEMKRLRDIWGMGDDKAAYEQSKVISKKLRGDLTRSKQGEKWKKLSPNTLGVVPPIPATNFRTIVIGVDAGTHYDVKLDGKSLIPENTPKTQLPENRAY